MKHLILTTTILLISTFTHAQTNLSKIFIGKNQIEKNIIGQWKGFNLSVKCDDLKSFNHIMGTPIVKNIFETQTSNSSLEFMTEKKLIKSTLSGIDTSKYEVSENFIDFINFDKTNKEVVRKNKIISITEDTLIFSYEIKTDSPELALFLKMMNLENEKDKIVTYTFSYCRIKEAKAPWNFILNDLPKRKTATKLVNNHSIIYTIVKGNYLDGSAYDSVFYSIDNGIHWTPSSKGLTKFDGYTETETNLIPAGKKLFLGNHSGIYSSENNGQSWSKISTISINDSSYHNIIMASTNSNICILVDSILYVSKDNGVNWNLKNKLIANDFTMNLDLSSHGSNIIIGGTYFSNNSTFLLLSEDNGDTWKDIDNNFDKTEFPGINTTRLFISGSSIFRNTQYGMFVSMDKGKKWEKISINLPNTNSGETFMSDIIRGISFNTILSSDNYIFCGGNQGMFYSNDNGLNWKEINNQELRNGVSSFTVKGTDIFAISPENKLWKATISELVKSAE